MKITPAAWLNTAFAIGISLTVYGQDHAASLPQSPDYSAARTGIGTNSRNSSGASATATPDPEQNTDENDDTLYHGKTSDMDTTLLRDDGALHFKTRPKEKIRETSVTDLKKSGADPTFQGSLINSGTSSIQRIAEKANSDLQRTNEPADPRFGKRNQNLTFTPQKEDEAKKGHADPSPSPTPSPSASAAQQKSNQPGQ